MKMIVGMARSRAGGAAPPADRRRISKAASSRVVRALGAIGARAASLVEAEEWKLVCTAPNLVKLARAMAS